MSKKNKYKNKQFTSSKGNNHSPKENRDAAATQAVVSNNGSPSQQVNATPTVNGASGSFRALQPEQMSLEAYRHIQECLDGRDYLEKGDVTAVMELSQHLRVFGLLSAVGYVRHARDGEKRKRIRPMWTPLLWRLVCGNKAKPEDEKQIRQALMHATYTLSTQNQKGYMVTWRRALKLSNHWNFWARACQEEEAEKSDEQSTENGSTAG